MAAPTLWYCNGLKKALDAVVALGTPKLMLLGDDYVLEQDAHDFVNDVSAYEAAGSGYTAGGITLASVTVSVDAASNTVTLDAADVTGLSISACYAVVFVDTGSSATSPVLTVTDLSAGAGADVAMTGIVWAASGIAAITAA
ncbi:MAG: hypothetical protein QM662_18620 [Gordonia sp. (in: high G+C Gram-positive bacteria)]